MLSIAYLRTLFTASFVAVVIAACGGSSGSADSTDDDSPSAIRIINFQFLAKELNPVHGTYYPIDGQPVDSSMKALMKVSGGVDDLEIFAVDAQTGEVLSDFNVERTTTTVNGQRKYFGSIDIPSTPFKMAVSYPSLSSGPLLYEEIYAKTDVEVEFFESQGIVFSGQSETIKLKIKNNGDSNTFSIKIHSSNESLFPSYEDIVTIEDEYVLEQLVAIPSDISEPDFVKLKASATSTSQSPGTNTADFLITVLPQ